MVDLKNKLKKLSSISGYKIIIGLFLIGTILLVTGKYLQSSKQESTAEKNSVTHTEQEEKLAEILSKTEGVGEVEVIVYTKDNISSVLVLATGADDPEVNIKIRQIVRTLLQTDNKNIKILKKQS